MKTKNILAFGALIVLSGCVTSQIPNQKGSGTMEIVSATYGENCGAARGSATAHMAGVCNETDRCEYQVNYQVLRDPQKACAKEFEAEYRCSRGGVRHRVFLPGESTGQTVELTCSRFFGF